MKTTQTVTPEMVQGLDMVRAGKACSVGLGTLRALARRGLIKLVVQTVRYPHRGRTVCEIDVQAEPLP